MQEVERCTSTASPKMSFGRLARREPGDGREMMDSPRGGAVWRRGGVDGKAGNVDASVPTLKMDW